MYRVCTSFEFNPSDKFNLNELLLIRERLMYQKKKEVAPNQMITFQKAM